MAEGVSFHSFTAFEEEGTLMDSQKSSYKFAAVATILRLRFASVHSVGRRMLMRETCRTEKAASSHANRRRCCRNQCEYGERRYRHHNDISHDRLSDAMKCNVSASAYVMEDVTEE